MMSTELYLMAEAAAKH